jgi:hypothetical protein
MATAIAGLHPRMPPSLNDDNMRSMATQTSGRDRHQVGLGGA